MAKDKVLSLKKYDLESIRSLIPDHKVWQHSKRTAQEVSKVIKKEDLIVAALLHDSLENNYLTEQQIKEKFNPQVSFLVKSVSDTNTVDASTLPKNRRDDFYQNKLQAARKMLLQSGQDLRVVLLKMVEYQDNLTREEIPKWRKKQIARFSLLVLAPIAERLLLTRLKNNLTELSFKILEGKKFNKLKKKINQQVENFPQSPDKLKSKINQELKKQNVRAKLQSRIKNIYSTHKKLKRNNWQINDLHDLVGIRAIVSNKSDCYKTLGAVNRLWEPKKVKDYINNPKENGYQSIHTIIKLGGSQLFEVQIRTDKMHEKSEKGIWAHWQYKQNGSFKEDKVSRELKWVKELTQKLENANRLKNLEELRINLFKDRIFVYSPKNEVIELPKGSTPIDYAYRIHSDLGNNLERAKVNGKLVKLSYQLKNGQKVEVVTKKDKNNQAPTRDWLNYAITKKAQEHIRKRLSLEKQA